MSGPSADDPRPTPSAASAAAEAHAAYVREIEARKQFLALTEEDAVRLRAWLPWFRASRETFVDTFYGHLRALPQTAKFLADPERFSRLRDAQMRHFETLLQADWNEQYVVDRSRAGRMHAEAGIEPQYVLGSYLLYAQHCLGELAKQQGVSPEFSQAATSFFKALFFDMGLLIDTYFAQSTENLRQALDLYWKANAELRQFARFASHDLKTPLATVANLCEEAVDEFGRDMPDEARRLIDSARKRAHKMSHLIDELLSVSIDGHVDDRFDEFPSGDALREAIERAQPELRAARVKIHTPDNCPYVWGSVIRLREAFYNLISNAAKFMHRHEGRIDVTFQIEPRAVVFCFADNGPGIPANEHERVFQPFRRAHREHGGSGLGLYFAKNLVEQQGGRIWVESTIGEGSRFYIQVPREATPLAAHRPPSQGEKGEA